MGLKNAPNAYNAAYRRGLLDELFTTTTQSQGGLKMATTKYTYAHIKEVASTYAL